jgi:hypothetical protein
MAAHAAREGLTAEEIERARAPGSTGQFRGQFRGQFGGQFGGQQWRFERARDDVLDYPQINHQQAADQVSFLLTGNDAEHAPAFLAAIREATSSAAAAAADGAAFEAFPASPQPARPDSRCDQLIHQLAGAFAAWKENPSAGQPVFEPAKDVSPEILALEREMLVLLKLQRRFEASRTLQRMAETAGLVRTKVVVFDPAKGASAAAANKQTPVRSFADLAGQLTDPSRPAWATLDVDGSLLLSTDSHRVRELIGGFDQPYSVEQSDRQVLVRRLEGQRVLRGWLVENAKDKTRPIANFEVVDLRKLKANAAGNDKRQARRLHHD